MLRAGVLGFAVLAFAGIASAQFFDRLFRGRQDNYPESVRTAREIGTRSTDTPMWENPLGFEKDVLTFARLRFDRTNRRASGGWTTDLPDADLNLSYRIQQMTAMKVDPYGRILRASDPELAKYPFLFASAPGAMYLYEDEINGLRRYLKNGGFLLVDDFWANAEWENFAAVMREVLPGRQFVDLPDDHPIYRIIFRLPGKVQVPRIGIGLDSLESGVTWEQGEEGRQVHHRAIFDEKGRMMVLALHNTDTADAWEREGENRWYFNTYSEKYAFPLGINILFYIMTH